MNQEEPLTRKSYRDQEEGHANPVSTDPSPSFPIKTRSKSRAWNVFLNIWIILIILGFVALMAIQIWL